MKTVLLRIGHLVPDDWPEPRGGCADCGGQCDGDNGCGSHKAGCVFGGFGHGYWMIADGCALDHGPTTCVVKGCCT